MGHVFCNKHRHVLTVNIKAKKKVSAPHTTFSPLFFNIGLQRYSDGVFDQRDNSTRVPSMGGVRPEAESPGGQAPGCTEPRDRWACN